MGGFDHGEGAGESVDPSAPTLRVTGVALMEGVWTSRCATPASPAAGRAVACARSGGRGGCRTAERAPADPEPRRDGEG